MAKTLITGHAQEARKAQIYEPRQSPEQEEVLLEEFVLAPGEEREYELRSATAGYRLIPLGPDDHPPEDTRREEPQPDQEGPMSEATRAEIEAGKQAVEANRDAPVPPGARNHPSATTDAPRGPAAPAQPREAAPRKSEEPKQAPKPSPKDAADSGTKPAPKEAPPKSDTLKSAEKTEQSAEQTRKAAENQKETK